MPNTERKELVEEAEAAVKSVDDILARLKNKVRTPESSVSAPEVDAIEVDAEPVPPPSPRTVQQSQPTVIQSPEPPPKPEPHHRRDTVVLPVPEPIVPPFHPSQSPLGLIAQLVIQILGYAALWWLWRAFLRWGLTTVAKQFFAAVYGLTLNPLPLGIAAVLLFLWYSRLRPNSSYLDFGIQVGIAYALAMGV